MTYSSGSLNVLLGIDSGLTFSGDDIILDTNIAGNGLDFSSGVLSVNTSEITNDLAGNGAYYGNNNDISRNIHLYTIKTSKFIKENCNQNLLFKGIRNIFYDC